jgi:hypothetical protein
MNVFGSYRLFRDVSGEFGQFCANLNHFGTFWTFLGDLTKKCIFEEKKGLDLILGLKIAG